MTVSYDQTCVGYLKALADPTRWEIMGLLSDSRGPLCLGDVAGALELSTYNASRHVRVLMEAGLVMVVRDGRFKRISVAPQWQVSNGKDRKHKGAIDLGCCSFKFSKRPKGR